MARGQVAAAAGSLVRALGGRGLVRAGEIDRNFLLNPRHPAFRAIRVGRPAPFAFDPRIRETRR